MTATHVSDKMLYDYFHYYGLKSNFKKVDAKKDFTFTPNASDFRKAERSDPGFCVNAQCLARYGIPAIFLRSRAYFMRSSMTLEKYVVPNGVNIDEMLFDVGGNPNFGEVTLKAPSGTQKVGGRSGVKNHGVKKSRTEAERRNLEKERIKRGSDARTNVLASGTAKHAKIRKAA